MRLIAVVVATVALPAVTEAEPWNPFGPLHTSGSILSAPAVVPTRPRASGTRPPLPRPPPIRRPVAFTVPKSIVPETASGGARPKIEPAETETIPFPSTYVPGSIVIDTSKRRLYFVLTESSAFRYPISVGREGFQWTGVETVSRMQAWPDWRPPAEMRERDPSLPVLMTGGLKNPLGAMAIYLGDTLYRIHGTNDLSSIGRAASSGCFRMRNDHVLHLAQHVQIGAVVTVVDGLPPEIAKVLPEEKKPVKRHDRRG